MMLMLLVYAGCYTYAINAALVKRVIPQVKVVRIPHVPKCFLGHINIYGKPVPVADLSLIVRDAPSCNNMHTRIVLLNTTEAEEGLFGILAERVTEMLELDFSAFVESGIQSEGLPFLGPTLYYPPPRFAAEDGINKNAIAIQWLDVEKLFLFLRSEIISFGMRSSNDVENFGKK